MTPAFVPSPAETRARASLSARLWCCARRAEDLPLGSLASLPANRRMAGYGAERPMHRRSTNAEDW